MARNSEVIERAATSSSREDDDAAHYGKIITNKLRRLPPSIADDVMSRVFILFRSVENELTKDAESNDVSV